MRILSDNEVLITLEKIMDKLETINNDIELVTLTARDTKSNTLFPDGIDKLDKINRTLKNIHSEMEVLYKETYEVVMSFSQNEAEWIKLTEKKDKTKPTSRPSWVQFRAQNRKRYGLD